MNALAANNIFGKRYLGFFLPLACLFFMRQMEGAKVPNEYTYLLNKTDQKKETGKVSDGFYSLLHIPYVTDQGMNILYQEKLETYKKKRNPNENKYNNNIAFHQFKDQHTVTHDDFTFLLGKMEADQYIAGLPLKARGNDPLTVVFYKGKHGLAGNDKPNQAVHGIRNNQDEKNKLIPIDIKDKDLTASPTILNQFEKRVPQSLKDILENDNELSLNLFYTNLTGNRRTKDFKTLSLNARSFLVSGSDVLSTTDVKKMQTKLTIYLEIPIFSQKEWDDYFAHPEKLYQHVIRKNKGKNNYNNALTKEEEEKIKSCLAINPMGYGFMNVPLVGGEKNLIRTWNDLPEETKNVFHTRRDTIGKRIETHLKQSAKTGIKPYEAFYLFRKEIGGPEEVADFILKNIESIKKFKSEKDKLQNQLDKLPEILWKTSKYLVPLMAIWFIFSSLTKTFLVPIFNRIYAFFVPEISLSELDTKQPEWRLIRVANFIGGSTGDILRSLAMFFGWKPRGQKESREIIYNTPEVEKWCKNHLYKAIKKVIEANRAAVKRGEPPIYDLENIVLTGDAGVGKSFKLEQAFKRLEEEGYITFRKVTISYIMKNKERIGQFFELIKRDDNPLKPTYYLINEIDAWLVNHDLAQSDPEKNQLLLLVSQNMLQLFDRQGKPGFALCGTSNLDPIDKKERDKVYHEAMKRRLVFFNVPHFDGAALAQIFYAQLALSEKRMSIPDKAIVIELVKGSHLFVEDKSLEAGKVTSLVQRIVLDVEMRGKKAGAKELEVSIDDILFHLNVQYDDYLAYTGNDDLRDAEEMEQYRALEMERSEEEENNDNDKEGIVEEAE